MELLPLLSLGSELMDLKNTDVIRQHSDYIILVQVDNATAYYAPLLHWFCVVISWIVVQDR